MAGFEDVAAEGGTEDAGFAPSGGPDPGNSVLIAEDGPATAPALDSSG